MFYLASNAWILIHCLAYSRSSSDTWWNENNLCSCYIWELNNLKWLMNNQKILPLFSVVSLWLAVYLILHCASEFKCSHTCIFYPKFQYDITFISQTGLQTSTKFPNTFYFWKTLVGFSSNTTRYVVFYGRHLLGTCHFHSFPSLLRVGTGTHSIPSICISKDGWMDRYVDLLIDRLTDRLTRFHLSTHSLINTYVVSISWLS